MFSWLLASIQCVLIAHSKIYHLFVFSYFIGSCICICECVLFQLTMLRIVSFYWYKMQLSEWDMIFIVGLLQKEQEKKFELHDQQYENKLLFLILGNLIITFECFVIQELHLNRSIQFCASKELFFLYFEELNGMN